MKNKGLMITLICLLSVLLVVLIIALVLILPRYINKDKPTDKPSVTQNNAEPVNNTQPEQSQPAETQPQQPQTTAPNPVELSQADIEDLEKALNQDFLFYCPNYDSQNMSYYEFLSRYNVAIYAGVYQEYFGECQSYNATETPDPTNEIRNRYGDGNYAPYVVLEKEKVDWIAINVYNIPEEKVKAANPEECGKAISDEYALAYYYNGNYYITAFGRGYECGIHVDSYVITSDGKYKVYIQNYEDNLDYISYNEKGEVIVSAEYFNGQRYWSIHSARLYS